MTIAATEAKLLKTAELRTKDTMNPKDFEHINTNLNTLRIDQILSTSYQDNIKTIYLELSIIEKNIIVMKTSGSQGAKSKGRVFKIALSEFEAVIA